MELNLDRVRNNVRESSDEDLLDRITVYRAGMEPDAIHLIEAELRARGVSPAEVRRHAEERSAQGISTTSEVAPMCSFCRRPAVAEFIGWHRLWGIVPIFPRLFRCCPLHLVASARK
jgi:hypothetical protein